VIEPTSMLGPLGAESSSSEVYGAVRRAILDGTLRPGERIVEQRLAQMLDVSRTPVREALLKLERDNLVARSGRGMAVRTFSAEEVYDIYDLRAHVESYAAQRAATRVTDAELAQMRRVEQELEAETRRRGADELEQLRTLARLNQHFHMLVVRAAASVPLERIVAGVGQTPLVYKAYLWYEDRDRQRSTEQHDALLERLAAGDAEGAERVWRDHIEQGRDVLVGKLAAQGPAADAGF
jgi:DNA-binding GntR family transcriptional regulator